MLKHLFPNRAALQLPGMHRGSFGWKTLFVLFALVFLFSFPSLNNDWVNFGDDQYFLETHPVFQKGFLSGSDLPKVFQWRVESSVRPLFWIELAVLKALLGNIQAWHIHLLSLVLLEAFVLLCFLVGLSLFEQWDPVRYRARFERISICLLTAMLVILFSPKHVEAVAWASGHWVLWQGFFLLASLLFYLSANRNVRPKLLLGVSLACYGISLGFGPETLFFPFWLVLLDYFPLGRWGASRAQALGTFAKRVWIEKGIFIFLSFLWVYLIGVDANPVGDFWRSLGIAAYQVCVSLGESLWPSSVVAYYPLTSEFGASHGLMNSAIAFVTVLSVIAIVVRPWAEPFFVGWFLFVLTRGGLSLFLPLELRNSMRYEILCFPPLVLMLSSLFFWCLARWEKYIQPRFKELAVVFVLILSFQTWKSWNEFEVWRNGTTLWNHVLRFESEQNPKVYERLGNLALDESSYDEAQSMYQRALELDPSFMLARFGLARVASAEQRWEEAEKELKEILIQDPMHLPSLKLKVVVLVSSGEFQTALKMTNDLINLWPEDFEARLLRAEALLELKDYGRANESIQEALSIRPNDEAALWVEAEIAREQSQTKEIISPNEEQSAPN